MEKDFKRWNELKEQLDKTDQEADFGLTYQSRQLWMCSVGVNIGSEQDGHGPLFSRPVLIFRVFNTCVFWGIPITTKVGKGDLHFEFNLGGVDEFVILSQMRLFSVKRLNRLITIMPEEMFSELLLAFTKLLPESKIPLAGEFVAEPTLSADTEIIDDTKKQSNGII